MRALKHRDLRTALSALELLHADMNPATLAQRTLEAVSLMVPADVIQFNGFELTGEYSGVSWGTAEITSTQLHKLALFVHEHPFFPHFTSNQPQEIPLKISEPLLPSVRPAFTMNSIGS